MPDKRIYETVFILHPEMSEEDVEAGVQNTVSLLETNGSEIIRTERGGKRRLAYPVEKQRYGFYSLIHFHGTSESLVELERMYRLNDRVLRYLTVRFDKEDQLTGLNRMGDDDGRDDDRDGRRGRRGDFQGRGPRDRFDRDDRDDRDDRGRDRDRDRDRDGRRPPRVEEMSDEQPDDEFEEEADVESPVVPEASTESEISTDDDGQEVSEESH